MTTDHSADRVEPVAPGRKGAANQQRAALPIVAEKLCHRHAKAVFRRCLDLNRQSHRLDVAGQRFGQADIGGGAEIQ